MKRAGIVLLLLDKLIPKHKCHNLQLLMIKSSQVKEETLTEGEQKATEGGEDVDL